MPQEIINNGESGLSVRSKLNSNFTELYLPTTAAEVTNTPTGTIGSINVQGAINELDGDIQNINDNFAAASRGNTEDMLVAGANIALAPSGVGAARQLTVSTTAGPDPSFEAATLFRPLAGAFIANLLDTSALGTLTNIANLIRISPFVTYFEQPVDQAGVSVSTGVAGALVKVVVYESDLTGRPTTLLAESSDIDCATVATRFVPFIFTFQAGKMYWLGIHSNSTAVIRGPSATAAKPLTWTNAATPVTNRTLTRTVPYGPSGNWGAYSNAQLSVTGAGLILFRTV